MSGGMHVHVGDGVERKNAVINQRLLTYGMCWNAALVHGALRARDGVDSLRQCALQRPSNAFSSCASAMGLPPSPAGMAWRRPKN